jgi:hypothetical protein
MAGVEQQRDAGAGIVHEGVELGLGLDHRRHVVVVAERHALLGGPFAEGRHLPGVGLHLVVAEPGLLRQRDFALALDRAADLAVDDARRIHRLEQLDHRGDALLVGRDLFVDQRA